MRKPNMGTPDGYLRNGAECLLLLEDVDKIIGAWHDGEGWRPHMWHLDGGSYGFKEFNGDDATCQLDIVLRN